MPLNRWIFLANLSVAGRSTRWRSAVARQLVKLGGRPEYRQNVVTDNGNVILMFMVWKSLIPSRWKTPLTRFRVVTVGLFANRGADVALIGTPDGENHRKMIPAKAYFLPRKNSVRGKMVTCITFNRLPCRKKKVIPGIFICWLPAVCDSFNDAGATFILP